MNALLVETVYEVTLVSRGHLDTSASLPELLAQPDVAMRSRWVLERTTPGSITNIPAP
jgi:hypothetical protein